MRRFISLISAAGILLALSACGGDPAPPPAPPTDPGPSVSASVDPQEELIKAAQAEGKIVFYMTEPDALNSKLGAAFKARYGIDIEFLRLTSTQLAERFAQEQAAGVHLADLLALVGSNIWEDNPEWFVNLEEANLEGWAEWPAEAKQGVCTHTRYSIGGVTYNNQLVDAEHIPTSYEDFLDPWWKGKILLTDPRATPAYMGWAAMIEEKYGLEWLEAFSKQDFTLVDSASPAAEQLAAGAAYANFGAHLSNSTDIRGKGAPLDFVIMSDVPTGLPTCEGIVASAPHPNAAKLFMQWILTYEGQNAGCQVFDAATVLKGTDCKQLPDGWKPTKLDVTRDPDRQARILSALGLQ